MPFPQTIRDAAYPEQTGEAFVFLVTINHPDLEEPIRLTNSGRDITTGGNLYISAPIEIHPPGQSDEVQNGRLVVPNIDQAIGEAIELIRDPPTVTIVAVLESNPTIQLAEPFTDLLMQNIRGDAEAVSGELSMPQLSSEPLPRDTLHPAKFLAVFRKLS